MFPAFSSNEWKLLAEVVVAAVVEFLLLVKVMLLSQIYN